MRVITLLVEIYLHHHHNYQDVSAYSIYVYLATMHTSDT